MAHMHEIHVCISYIQGARAECLNWIQPEHPVYNYFVSYHNALSMTLMSQKICGLVVVAKVIPW